MNGIDGGDQSGLAVSGAGDVDKDGYDDVIIGAPHNADGGEAYAFLGKKSGYKSSFDLDDLDGSNGFTVHTDIVVTTDHLGMAVGPAGDVDGDGYDDIILGSTDDNDQYLLWGESSRQSSNWTSNLPDDLYIETGTAQMDDFHNRWVDTVGDVNGDGKDDFIIGEAWDDADNDGNGIAFDSGQSWVIFGGSKSSLGTRLNVADLDGSNGFAIPGVDVYDLSGNAVSGTGDLNDDGYDDIIVGAKYGDAGGGASGEAYVIFGKSSFSDIVDPARLNGSSGFRLDGADGGDQAGFSVSEAGDVNGDGIADLLVGAPYADPDNRSSAGEVYVVFGKKSGYQSTWDLDSLTDSEGFVVQGIDPNDNAGHAINAAGDVNKDGYDDIIIGAPGAANKKGETYVLFGGDFTGDSTISGASGSDDLTVSAMSIDQDTPLRDMPLTPGDDYVVKLSGSAETCLGYAADAPPVVVELSGDGSDILSTGQQVNEVDEDEE